MHDAGGIVGVADKPDVSPLRVVRAIRTGKTGRELILAKGRGRQKKMPGSCSMAERDGTEYPDDLNGSVADTDLFRIATEDPADPFLEFAVRVVRVTGKAGRITVPVYCWGKGIDTRAEIQHVFVGFFPLSLSRATMNHLLWKVNSH